MTDDEFRIFVQRQMGSPSVSEIVIGALDAMREYRLLLIGELQETEPSSGGALKVRIAICEDVLRDLEAWELNAKLEARL